MRSQILTNTDLRSRSAHDFVTPNEPVTVRFVCSHRRDVDDVVASDEAEQEEGTDNEFGPSRNWCRGGEDDYPPAVVERGGEPRHVLDHVLSLGDRIGLCDVLERCETHLHAAGIVDRPYLRYLNPGNREGVFELRQRFQGVVESTVYMRDVEVDGPVCAPDVSLITKLARPANASEADPIRLECLRRPV